MQLRIMVLDASPTSRKILEFTLRREGHQVVAFGDSVEALRFLNQYDAPNLLFLGLDLPRLDGYEVLRYLKGEPRFRHLVSVALLNGREGILSLLKARLAGAHLVVSKPLVRERIVGLAAGSAWQKAAAREIEPGSPAVLAQGARKGHLAGGEWD